MEEKSTLMEVDAKFKATDAEKPFKLFDYYRQDVEGKNSLSYQLMLNEDQTW